MGRSTVATSAAFWCISMWPVGAHAETAGPDSVGAILIDSSETDGPPAGWVDMTDGVGIEPGPAALPFSFGIGGETYTSATVNLEG